MSEEYNQVAQEKLEELYRINEKLNKRKLEMYEEQYAPTNRSLKEQITDRIDRRKKEIKDLNSMLESLNECKYSEGDLVMTKKHGIGIIQNITIHNGKIEVRIAHKTGIDHYSLESIVPYNPTSEAIYGE